MRLPEPDAAKTTVPLPLRQSLAAGRIHSAYLFAGAGERPRAAAESFARALACTGERAARADESARVAREDEDAREAREAEDAPPARDTESGLLFGADEGASPAGEIARDAGEAEYEHAARADKSARALRESENARAANQANGAQPTSAAADERPCEACEACERSAPEAEPPALDGTGRSGPLLRHIGAHPDLMWVERGAGETRVRITQIREVQHRFHLQSATAGRRVAVIADAEWLNLEAQNALLRLLEEPPPNSTLLLVSAQPAGLLATVRSRTQRVNFPPARVRSPRDPDAPDAAREVAAKLDGLGACSASDLLDWAEEFRGPRQVSAPALAEWLGHGAAWLHAVTCDAAAEGADTRALLRAWDALQHGRKALAQRNANPQMVAERVLFALRDACGARA